MTPTPLPTFCAPAEWAPHEACWTAWPAHAELWGAQLPAAQAEFTELCRALADVDPVLGSPRGENLQILVPSPKACLEAEAALKGLGARFHEIGYGDIWLRDTAPIFVHASGPLGPSLWAMRFAFNGWGGKYRLPHDAEVALQVASLWGGPSRSYEAVLEGGSLEMDGEGTCLTTRQCLLNPNRNPGMDQAALEDVLKEAFGVQKTLWLSEGLLNDHTDGHIDTLVRFVAPATVVCMRARDPQDPNHAVLEQIHRDLQTFTDAQGRPLKVISIPSPGRVRDEEGELMAASFVNFFIGNTTVAVPVYGTDFDDEAVAAIAACFPGRRTLGLPAKAILGGGGAFHCITQQQPRLGGPR